MIFLIKRKNFRLFRNYLSALAIDFAGCLLFAPLRVNYLLWKSFTGRKLLAPRRILFIKTDHIGDVLLITPALRACRKKFPDAKIECVVGPWAAPILRGNPDVDGVVTVNLPWHSRRAPDSWRKIFDLTKSLRRRRPDLCFILRPDIRDIAFGFLTGARERAGVGGKGGGFMLTRPVAFDPETPAIRRHEAVLRSVGVDTPFPPRPIFNLSQDLEKRADNLLSGVADSALLVGIAPEGGLPVKRWRNEAWRETALELIEKFGAAIVFLGDPGAKKLILEISSGLPPEKTLDLSGRTTLEEMAAVISKLGLLLTVDSAPRHFAAAFGTPTVSLQWAAPPRAEWAAYTSEQTVVRESIDCDACGRPNCKYRDVPCMGKITPARVLEEAERLLKTGIRSS